jgi:hypothetical protein
MVDSGGLPLRRAPVEVRDEISTRLADGWASDSGSYCLGDDTIVGGEKYQVCVQVAAGKHGCAAGAPNTVAGGMLSASGFPLKDRAVAISDVEGQPVASGQTDGDGMYCITHEAIKPGQLYRVCATPAPMSSVSVGINGILFGPENARLPQAPVAAIGPNGEVLEQSRTGFDGTFCMLSENVPPGMQKVCIGVVPRAASCSGGSPKAVSGAILSSIGDPYRFSPLTVEREYVDPETEEKRREILASGSTDDNGAYCIIDESLQPDQEYELCLDMLAQCSCCCSCCCAPLVLYIPPAASSAAAIAAAGTATGIGIAITQGDDDEPEVSPSR